MWSSSHWTIVPSTTNACPCLGAAADFDVLLPPKAWLGTPWRAGSTAELGAWVEERATAADALVVAVDTLAYGGLVNARRSPEPAGYGHAAS